jgi:hypothetical protein
MDRLRTTGRSLAPILVLAGLGALSGCVERRYTIRTNPPGAQVVVNGQELGPSPVSAPFTFYGDREITLIKEGFQRQTIIQPIRAPWWDNLLTEFFTENFIPYTFRDERVFDYQLAPATLPETNDLLGRGEALRAQAQAVPPPRRRWFFGLFGS